MAPVRRGRSVGITRDAPAVSVRSSVERIDTPERQTPQSPAEIDGPWLVQLGASDERSAVTVQLRPSDGTGSIRVDDSWTFETGTVRFAYCDRSGEAIIYHREEPKTRDDHRLLWHVGENLSEAEGATLVTCGSDHALREMFYHRLARVPGGSVVPTGGERVLDDCFHATQGSVAIRTAVDTLVEVVDQLDIEAGREGLAVTERSNPRQSSATTLSSQPSL